MRYARRQPTNINVPTCLSIQVTQPSGQGLGLPARHGRGIRARQPERHVRRHKGRLPSRRHTLYHLGRACVQRPTGCAGPRCLELWRDPTQHVGRRWPPPHRVLTASGLDATQRQPARPCRRESIHRQRSCHPLRISRCIQRRFVRREPRDIPER